MTLSFCLMKAGVWCLGEMNDQHLLGLYGGILLLHVEFVPLFDITAGKDLNVLAGVGLEWSRA